MPGPSSGDDRDELARARDGIVGVRGGASLKSWFPSFRQAQGLLSSNEALIQALVRTIPFDLWAVDAEGRFVLQNEASLARVGPLVGKRPADLPISADAIEGLERNLEKALAGETLSGERRVVDGSGERWSLEIIAPVLAERPDEAGGTRVEGAVGVVIDISDRKLAEERLRRANAALEETVAERTEEIRRANADLAERNRRLASTLEELQASREALLRSERLATTARMAGRVAHELNTPLGALLSSVNGIEELLASGLVGLAESLASLDARELAFCGKLIAAGAAAARSNPQARAPRSERRALEAELVARGAEDPVELADLLLDVEGAAPFEPGDLDFAARHSEVPAIADGFVQLARASAIARRAAEMAAAAVRSIEKGVADAYAEAPGLADPAAARPGAGGGADPSPPSTSPFAP